MTTGSLDSKITLRRAAKIRNRLIGRLAELRTKLSQTDVQISVYDPNPVKSINKNTNDFNEVISRFMAVSRLILSIRSKIGDVNDAAGINVLLTEQEALRGQYNVLKQLSDIEPRSDLDTVSAKLDGLKSRALVSQYRPEDTCEVSVVTVDIVVATKSTLQQLQTRLDEIQDKLESINSNYNIQLSDSELSLLESEKII